LFDLQKDPQEMRSVFGQPEYAATTAELEKELARLRKELKAPEVVPPAWFGRGAEGAQKKNKQGKQKL
jgi:hypothetical protein